MKTTRRAGYMLLEVLAVAFILAIVLGLAGDILFTCTRLSAFGTRAAERNRELTEIEEAFRDAAREAFAVSPGIGSYRSGADTVVLETPSTEGRRCIVIGRLRDASHVSVLKLAEQNGALESDYLSTLALPTKALAFEYDSGNPETARRITMRLTTQGREKAAQSREITAALGAVATVVKP